MNAKTDNQTRRAFLSRLGLFGAAAAAAGPGCALGAGEPLRRGRLKQSVAGWCFIDQGPRWDVETLARTASGLGCEALELVEPEHWDTLRRYGLICAATIGRSLDGRDPDQLGWRERERHSWVVE